MIIVEKKKLSYTTPCLYSLSDRPCEAVCVPTGSGASSLVPCEGGSGDAGTANACSPLGTDANSGAYPAACNEGNSAVGNDSTCIDGASASGKESVCVSGTGPTASGTWCYMGYSPS